MMRLPANSISQSRIFQGEENNCKKYYLAKTIFQ